MTDGVAIAELVEALEAVRPHPSTVIPTMSAVAPYVARGLGPGDFAYLPSSMGQAVPFALGIALGRPDLPVAVLVGDGSLLMNLGCLCTAAEAGARNLRIVVVENRVYEVTGGQPVVGGAAVDLPALAAACGLRWARRVERRVELPTALREMFSASETALLSVAVRRDPAAPPARAPGPAAPRFAALRRHLAGEGA